MPFLKHVRIGVLRIVAFLLATEIAYANVAGETTEPVLPASVIEHVGPAGLKTYRWDFSRVADSDFDRWPDDFTRHVETGYPEYVQISIAPRDPELESKILAMDTALLLRWDDIRRSLRWLKAAERLPSLPPSLADTLVDRCLQVQLDGGQARVITPTLPTSPRFQYRFTVDVRTKDLTHDAVYADVVFLDADNQELQRRSTPAVTRSPRWQSLTIESLVPPHGATSMKVMLNVISGDDGLQDIRGVIEFDNIAFRQFPQMKVTTDAPFGVYRRGQPVTTNTRLLGLPSEPTRVRLRLLDHDQNELQTTSKTLSAQDIAVNQSEQKRTKSPPDQQRASKRAANASSEAIDDAVSIPWTLDNLPPGYYVLAATMENDLGASLANKTSFVVVDRLTTDPREWSPSSPGVGPERENENSFAVFAADHTTIDPVPFGWTLPTDLFGQSRSAQYNDRAIAQWLRDVGVGWTKLPVWFAPDDTTSADTAANLAFRLKDFGIQPVGLLTQPPAANADIYQLRERGDSGIAAYLHDPAIWRDQLDTIMNRMTFRLRMWQLGDDNDFSFQGRPQLSEKIAEIGVGLQGFGQPLEIMIPWTWLDRPPRVSGESWVGLARDTEQPMTADELDAMLDLQESEDLPKASGRRANSKTWMTIDPLSATRYDRDARILDLVLRMATVRGHDVQCAFVRDPMNADAALIKSDGHPDELLLPWRTTSLLLGHSRNIGSLRLRNESNNVVFRSEHASVMLIWANTPRTERLFLGDGVYQVDVWGRRSEVAMEQVNGRTIHRIDVQPMPMFIVGIDPALAEFRMSVELSTKRIDSLLGQEQMISVRYHNPIGQALMGKISLAPPAAWKILPNEQDWELNPLDKGQSNFTVVLGNNATIGHFELPIDIDFATVPPTSIRVYRNIDVGPEGFDLVVSTRLIDDRLRVKIEMTNHTRRAAHFDCLLFAGGDRQYERRTLVVGPSETVERNIDWPDAADLVGQRLLLRAIEQEGARVINHSFEVVR